MKKYLDKYRSETTRLRNFDYGSDGYYAVTIVTNNRIEFFGEIRNYIMCLSEIGTYAYNCWLEIPNHFPFVILDTFIIMPDHIHGLLRIDKRSVETANSVQTQDLASPQNLESPQNIESPKDTESQQGQEQKWGPNKFGPQSKNLASIIRGYKIGVTKSARKINPSFKWQSRYYDSVMKNEKQLHATREYITYNVLNYGKKNHNL